MSIATEIQRIQTAKGKIATKLGDMGLADRTAPIETLADAIYDIADKGIPDIKIEEGKNVTLEPGYYHGGSITGINNEALDSVEFNLQPNKPVTPNKSTQYITKDEGYYGLAQVTVNPIPSEYQVVTQVDATKDDVLAGKKIVSKTGDVIVGEIPKYESPTFTLSPTNTSSTLETGYYSGAKVKVNVDDSVVEVTPTKQTQQVAAKTEGNFLKGVTVKGDDNLQAHKIASGVTIFGVTGTFTDDADLTVQDNGAFIVSPDLLEGKSAYANGINVYGSMPKADRAQTTISANANSAKDTITITANNPQSSGYVTSNTTKDTAEVTITQYVDGKKVHAWVNDGDAPIEASVADGAYSASVSLTKGAGSVSATGTNVTLTKASSKPSSGYYITATGSGSVSATGTATIGTAGWLEKDSKTANKSETSNTATAYYTIAGANVPTSINPLTETSVSVTAGYTSGGTISVSSKLLEALQAI